MDREWVIFRPGYAVSSLGEVKRLEGKQRNGRKCKEKILKPQVLSTGYLGVYLPDPETGKQKWEYIHRLVAKAFIPNPDNLPQVNHINEVKTDNRAENLEWCDNRYNVRYSLYRKEGKDYAGLTDEEIDSIRREEKLARQRDYNRKHYKPKMSHTIYAFRIKEVVSYEYELIGVYKNLSHASQEMGLSKHIISSRLKKPYKGILLTRDENFSAV